MTLLLLTIVLIFVKSSFVATRSDRSYKVFSFLMHYTTGNSCFFTFLSKETEGTVQFTCTSEARKFSIDFSLQKFRVRNVHSKPTYSLSPILYITVHEEVLARF